MSAEPAPEKEKRTPREWFGVFGVVMMLVGFAGFVVVGVAIWRDYSDTVSSVGIGMVLVGFLFGGLVEKFLNPHGDLVPQLLCPHCQHRGKVYRIESKQKDGISGGKATGAVLTGGTSLWFTGLSQEVKVAKLRCKNCDTKWTVRR